MAAAVARARCASRPRTRDSQGQTPAPIVRVLRIVRAYEAAHEALGEHRRGSGERLNAEGLGERAAAEVLLLNTRPPPITSSGRGVG